MGEAPGAFAGTKTGICVARHLDAGAVEEAQRGVGEPVRASRSA
jgi:hypothetical protein